ncbi:hypothetical protein MNBD_DELTA01-435 [hydrothermal vent metagenome]|uniref:DUF904 domain-containing protein n=1 Tax=hydrothermal vent metagenome TaxID=652676 RepID=A0A3B0QYG1_9ZZZZ
MGMKNFEMLEERLEELLRFCDDTEKDNNLIKEQLVLKEMEIKELRERLAKIEGEKIKVKEKVEGLITRLDGLTRSA